MIRLVEGAVAAGVGAADAFISDKAGAGPGGIPWNVLYEGGVLAVGLFGDKLGISAEIRDPMAFAGITIAARRLVKAADAGTLAQGPKAWGATARGAYSSGVAAANTPPSLPYNAAASIRLLPGRSATQSAFSMSPTLFEAAGVTG